MSLLSTIGAFISNSPTAKGKRGEIHTSLVLNKKLKNKGLNELSYQVFDDLTFHTADNATTQIDHLVVGHFGIFVIEVKNYSGWIFGSEKQYKWTQTFQNQSKQQFLNPLIQNKKHLNVVQKILEVDDNQIHSLVVFMNKVTFKTPMPDNVLTLSSMIDYILSFKEAEFTDNQCKKFLIRIKNRQLTKGQVANTVHMAHIDKKRARCEDKTNEKTHKKNSNQLDNESVDSNHQPLEKTDKQKVMPQNTKEQSDEAEQYTGKMINELTSELAIVKTATAAVTNKCPRCDSELIKRQAKKGKNVGGYFYGCSSFPKCRYTQKIEDTP